jgi:hypothetical protein
MSSLPFFVSIARKNCRSIEQATIALRRHPSQVHSSRTSSNTDRREPAPVSATRRETNAPDFVVAYETNRKFNPSDVGSKALSRPEAAKDLSHIRDRSVARQPAFGFRSRWCRGPAHRANRLRPARDPIPSADRPVMLRAEQQPSMVRDQTGFPTAHVAFPAGPPTCLPTCLRAWRAVQRDLISPVPLLLLQGLDGSAPCLRTAAAVRRDGKSNVQNVPDLLVSSGWPSYSPSKQAGWAFPTMFHGVF